MAKVSAILRSHTYGFTFFCPGCNLYHSINTVEGHGPCWGFNGNVDAPTFTPSILTWWNEPADPEAMDKLYEEHFRCVKAGDKAGQEKVLEQMKAAPKVSKRCHSFVTDGVMQFLSDCTHELAGKTAPIAPLPDPPSSLTTWVRATLVEPWLRRYMLVPCKPLLHTFEVLFCLLLRGEVAGADIACIHNPPPRFLEELHAIFQRLSFLD